MAYAFEIGLRVERLDGDALGRVPDEGVKRRFQLSCGKPIPVLRWMSHIPHLDCCTASLIGFDSVPMLPIVTSQTSPGLRNSGGVLA